MDKANILYIDDEIGNLNAFKASFRRDFKIYTTTSTTEGLEILRNNPIDVILADQRMPEKTGVDFFESIIGEFPNPIRILLTAYTDINAIIDAINKGRVYRYVTKPWNEFDLKITIENAYQLYLLREQNNKFLLREQNNKLNLKYRRVFAEATDPIVLFNTKAKIIDYNKATLALVNEPTNSLTLSAIYSSILHKSDLKHIIIAFKEKQIIKDYKCEILTKTGEKKVCLISGSAIKNNHNEVINYLVIIKDITERNKMEQLLLKRTIETQEEERERIARDLHDGVGQSLAAIKLQFESLKANYNQKQDITNQLIVFPEVLQSAIKELRQICFNAMPIVLQEHGLKKAIEELKINMSTPDFIIKSNYPNNLNPIENSLEISIFRIIQEFINNSLKHSYATEINISLNNTQHHLILNLQDNGIGFNLTDIETTNGRGLINIKNRVESFQGKIEIKSKHNSGTEFIIEFPLHH
jgi:PAS domain S-box-containing protein